MTIKYAPLGKNLLVRQRPPQDRTDRPDFFYEADVLAVGPLVEFEQLALLTKVPKEAFEFLALDLVERAKASIPRVDDVVVLRKFVGTVVGAEVMNFDPPQQRDLIIVSVDDVLALRKG